MRGKRGPKGPKKGGPGRKKGAKPRHPHPARARQMQRRTNRASRTLPQPHRAQQLNYARPAKGNDEEAEELQDHYEELMGEFQELDKRAELGDVYEEIGRIENHLTNLPLQLDELRARGFIHANRLEDRLEQFDEKWDEDVRPRVDQMLKSVVTRLDREVEQLNKRIHPKKRVNETMVDAMEAALERAEESIRSSEDRLESLYEAVMEGLDDIAEHVDLAEWMMTQIEESPEIELLESEGPILAAEVEWETDGEEEGPDGVLYVTDQRILFEQKEEIAKKKFLFITTQSESVQKLLLDFPIDQVETIESAQESKGMLGMRTKDLLNLVLVPTADHSRLRFEIKELDAAEIATQIKRVKSGDIDKDRVEEFMDELEEAQAMAVSFPTQCPSCYAAVPPQPRGTRSIVCEFCGATIKAQ